MKTRKKGRAVLAVLVLLLAGYGVFLRETLPDTFTVEEGQSLHFATMPWLMPMKTLGGAVQAQGQEPSSENTTLALLGVLPVKTVRTVAAEPREVTVCGTPFGIKMFSEGALIVGLSDISTAGGSRNPAKEAGLRMGDLIQSANGKAVHSNEDLAQALNLSGGDSVTVEFLRDGEPQTTALTPVKDANSGSWRAGVWVRDSSAGVGTLTFCDPESGRFAGLGHAISDSDTGQAVTLLSGEVVAVRISGVEKGSPGIPGLLQGDFENAPVFGTILANDQTGIYGTLQQEVEGETCQVAPIQEVKPGEAQIVTTLSGRTPTTFQVQIERVSVLASDPNRNMIIRVTDPRLLNATGGIVQGMSGSPILQDGRLVGAVTHVLVNDPTRGYGIFAQTMVERADSIERPNQN